MEKLLINQLEGLIEIPEVLHFACNDRTLLMDQLKVLQMVLRKERDKNKVNLSPATSSSPSETESLSTTVLDAKEDLKQKVEKHKKIMAQRREDKLKLMDAEAQALSKTLSDEESSKSKVSKMKRESVEDKCNKFNKCKFFYRQEREVKNHPVLL